MRGVMMEKLVGADAIADFLEISRRQFFKLKKLHEGTRYRAPVLTQYVGKPPYRRKILWTTKDLILAWLYQIQQKNS